MTCSFGIPTYVCTQLSTSIKIINSLKCNYLTVYLDICLIDKIRNNITSYNNLYDVFYHCIHIMRLVYTTCTSIWYTVKLVLTATSLKWPAGITDNFKFPQIDNKETR